MILIYRATDDSYSPDDYEPVARYDPDARAWVDDDADLAAYYPDGTDPAALLAAFDGPTYVAVDARSERAKAATLLDWEDSGP